MQSPAPKALLDKMVAARQLSPADAQHLAASAKGGVQTEEEVLRWLAREYGLAFTNLEDIEPDRQLLSLFPARILLKEELLPLRRLNGVVEVATSRLFATQGMDALKTLTGLNLRPVLACSEVIQREMKKRLGVGADTLDTLDEEASFQVVDETSRGGNRPRQRGRRRLHHPLRQPGAARRHRAARLGYPPRAVRRRVAHPLPH